MMATKILTLFSGDIADRVHANGHELKKNRGVVVQLRGDVYTQADYRPIGNKLLAEL